MITINYKNKIDPIHLLFTINIGRWRDGSERKEYRAYMQSNKLDNIYELITKIIKEKNKNDLILNLGHDDNYVRILCGEIIDNGYESIEITYNKQDCIFNCGSIVMIK